MTLLDALDSPIAWWAAYVAVFTTIKRKKYGRNA